ncbi:tectonic-3-like [Watersipora subatra]|uniref:tectonic-3-like n=1 Tax=Watersipora subatra TaxID=2589382 RepID=UPI00355BB962
MKIRISLFLLLVIAPCVYAQANFTTEADNSTNPSPADNATTQSTSTTTVRTTTVPLTTVTSSETSSTANETIDPELPAFNSAYQLNDNIPFCTCDLTPGICDINCCCDSSCSSADRVVFTSCDELLQSFPVTSVCLPVTSIFLNNAPFECQGVNGQCCLTRTDETAQNYFDPPAKLTYDRIFTEYESEYRSFSYSSTSSSEFLSKDVMYRNGDYLGTVTEVSNIRGLFMVPSQLPSGECLDGTPAKFLQDTTTTCRRDFKLPLDSVCATASYLDASGYTSISLLDAPYLYSESSISVNSRVNVTPVNEVAKANLAVQNNTCMNVVTKVTYTVIHSVGVLQAVNVEFEIDSFPGDITSLEQTFIVTYRDYNYTAFVPRSGNPGYIIGEPVISGFLVEPGRITFDPSRGAGLRILSPTLNGDCDLNLRRPVMFGKDMISSCILFPVAGSLRCFLSSPLSLAIGLDGSLNESAHIASFGNTLSTLPEDWVPLLRDEPPLDSHCSGFTIKLEILFSNVGTLVNPQKRIVGAKLNYETQMSYTETGLPLSTSQYSLVTIVSFLDVSSAPDTDIPPAGLTEKDYIFIGLIGGVTVVLFIGRILNS